MALNCFLFHTLRTISSVNRETPIKPYRFRIVLKMIRVIRVICEICGLNSKDSLNSLCHIAKVFFVRSSPDVAQSTGY